MGKRFDRVAKLGPNLLRTKFAYVIYVVCMDDDKPVIIQPRCDGLCVLLYRHIVHETNKFVSNHNVYYTATATPLQYHICLFFK